MTPWFLKLHRWVALVFALPLVVVLGTGLVLSIEPSLVVGAVRSGTLDVGKVEALLAKHDAEGRARALTFRSYDNTLSISAGRGGGTTVDVATGNKVAGPGALAATLSSARRLHEHFLFDLGWVVMASSIAMLVLAVLGIAQGWPRISNSLAGWHKAMAFGLLPLVVLSPLTGLLVATGITLAGPVPAKPAGPPLKLIDAVRVVGKSHDLSALVWLRSRGGQMLARVVDAGEYRVFQVGAAGTTAMPRNWPRLWHEGNFAGHISAGLNFVASIAMCGLLITGMWIWGRRQLRRRARRTA